MRNTIFIILVIVVIIIGLLHFFTPGHLFFYHDTYRRLSYFPIAIGAILFGIRGGLILAIMTSVAFIPHLILYISYGPESYLSELTEIVLYLMAGTVIGIIAGRESKLREKYKLISEKLEKSYKHLHEETELLIEVEEQLSASQRMSALGQLSASLAHEIKNPLSSIKGTAEILLDEFPEGHAKREFVDILLSEVSRLNTSVEQVLQYSKGQQIQEGNGAKEPLSVVIDKVAILIKGHLKGKMVDFRILNPSQGRSFQVNGNKLAQVFLNILLNAVDAVKNNGKIEIQVEEETDGISVSISDDGPGIPKGTQEKIFEPFFSQKDDGTGLGLSISQKIVASYNGTIHVSQSTLGGACFNVFIPKQDRW